MHAVSVLITVRDARPFLADAVRSVLDQQVDAEVIVVDDGSRDGSGDVLPTDSRIRLFRTPPRGLGAAFNLALEAARSPVVARCDADDRFAPGRLARQLELLAADPDLVAVAGSFVAMNPAGRVVPGLACPTEAADITAELRTGITRTHLNTFAGRTDAVRRTGGFRPFFRSAGDIDLQCRLGHFGRVWYDPAPAYFYRLHDASVTHTLARSVREWYEATARRFARQRFADGTDDLERGIPPIPPDAVSRPTTSREHVRGLLTGAAWREHAAGRRWAAMRLGWRACLVDPLAAPAWRGLAALLLKSR